MKRRWGAYCFTEAQVFAVCNGVRGAEKNYRGKPFRLKTRLKEGEKLNIGGYLLKMENDVLKADRSRVYTRVGRCGAAVGTPKLEGKCKLDIFVDENLIEIFINDGQYVLSQIVYDLGNYIEGYIECVMIQNN